MNLHLIAIGLDDAVAQKIHKKLHIKVADSNSQCQSCKPIITNILNDKNNILVSCLTVRTIHSITDSNV